MNYTEAAYEPLPASVPIFKRDRPVFEFNFNDYIGTVNGLFNFMEILGGATLAVLLSSSDARRAGDSKAERFLCGSGYTFSFNGFYMMVSSLLSFTSAVYLPALFYMVGLCTGGIHAFHFAYVCYKNYVEAKEKRWF
ncbi:uncharacterized protein [Dermacentor albipictus]|uniref:uncharacterized protein isoform X2 n=1 Tax=Dermacentor albipictus TaxID=60249 RepID=UPI0038FCA86A